jgi:putative ABC transport system ATP-binding protein
VSLLKLESVTKSYWRGPRELRVLRGASLEVRAGTVLAVYGQRNSGKTALLEVAAGFESPDAGRISFDGADLASLSGNALARVHREEIGWVEREGPHAPDLPVALHTALPLYGDMGRRAARRRALASLAAYDVERCADALWRDLSDFERIRCALAQAMVREPRLLIADDPTAGLGLLDREHVCALLRLAAEDHGIAVLMAVPDMPAMLHAHDLRILSRGRLIAPATRPDEEADVIDFPDGRRSA